MSGVLGRPAGEARRALGACERGRGRGAGELGVGRQAAEGWPELWEGPRAWEEGTQAVPAVLPQSPSFRRKGSNAGRTQPLPTAGSLGQPRVEGAGLVSPCPPPGSSWSGGLLLGVPGVGAAGSESWGSGWRRRRAGARGGAGQREMHGASLRDSGDTPNQRNLFLASWDLESSL